MYILHDTDLAINIISIYIIDQSAVFMIPVIAFLILMCVPHWIAFLSDPDSTLLTGPRQVAQTGGD